MGNHPTSVPGIELREIARTNGSKVGDFIGSHSDMLSIELRSPKTGFRHWPPFIASTKGSTVREIVVGNRGASTDDSHVRARRPKAHVQRPPFIASTDGSVGNRSPKANCTKANCTSVWPPIIASTDGSIVRGGP